MADASVTKMFDTAPGYRDLFHVFTQNLGSDLLHGAASFIHWLTPMLLLAFTTYIVLIIVEYRRQGIDEAIIGLGKKAVFWMFLTAFAANPNNYTSLANLIYNFPHELAGILFSANDKALDSNYLINSTLPIKEVLAELENYYTQVAWEDFGSRVKVILFEILISAGSNVSIIVAVGMFLIAKTLIVILLVIGPLFVCFLYFPQTRHWGIAWIAQLINLNLLTSVYLIIIHLYVSTVGKQFIHFSDAYKHIRNCNIQGFSPDCQTINGPTFLSDINSLIIISFGLSIIFLLAMVKAPTILNIILGGGNSKNSYEGIKNIIHTTSTAIASLAGRPANTVIGREYLFRRLRSNTIKPGGDKIETTRLNCSIFKCMFKCETAPTFGP